MGPRYIHAHQEAMRALLELGRVKSIELQSGPVEWRGKAAGSAPITERLRAAENTPKCAENRKGAVRL
jgi:hypothetical protein